MHHHLGSRSRHPVRFPVQLRLLSVVAILLGIAWMAPSPAVVGVVVVANYTDAKVDVAVMQPGGKTSRCSLKPRDLIPIPTDDKTEIAFVLDGKSHRRVLQANSIHCFVVLSNAKRDLIKIKLPSAPADGNLPPPSKIGAPLEPVYTVPVMLLVDDDEPGVQRLWEKRLRDRLAKASKITKYYCRVGFEVVAVDTWVSDDSLSDFNKTLREFESKVDPAPARLAIGFTSQYRVPSGTTHMGGTRGPFYPYILIREWSQHVTHAERLEILVHELGHFLGASHNPEFTSVMRPTLGDGRAHDRNFRIGFDVINTQVMYLVGEELRAGRYRGFRWLPPDKKARLRIAYTALSEFLPKDESVKHYLRLLDGLPSS